MAHSQILQRDLFVRRSSIYLVRISRWISRWISSSDFRVTPCKGIQDGLGFWIPRRSWILDSTPWISGFQVLDSSFFLLELGFRGPVVGGIPDSKDQDFVFHKRICSEFWIPQAKLSILTWDNSSNTHHASVVKTLCITAHASVQIQMPLMLLWSLKSIRDFAN